jgi:hypothetical protein
MMPEMQYVESSAIEMVGYEASSMILSIMWKGGATYLYSGVPEHLYDQLMMAESKGAFVNKFIKPNFPPLPL